MLMKKNVLKNEMKFLLSFIFLLSIICNVSFAYDLRIIDGDTIKIKGKKIRLFGIDAPELKQECLKESRPYFCGIVAKQNLEKYVQGKKINCEYTKLDRYKRILAKCRLNCFLGAMIQIVKNFL